MLVDSNIDEDYAELLRSNRRRPAYIFHQLRISVAETPDSQLFFLVEGNADRLFYMPYLRMLLPEFRVDCRVCWGFFNLAEVWRRLKGDNLFDMSRFGAIVDRDYSALAGINRADEFYVTPGYSVESVLMLEYTADVILSDGIGMEYHTDRKHYRDLYKTYMNAASIKMKSLCAIYAAIRIKGLAIDLDAPAIGPYITISDTFEFELRQKISPIMRSLLDIAEGEVTCGLVKDARRQMAAMQPIDWMRGKLVLALARKFFEAVRRTVTEQTGSAGSGIDLGENPLFAFLGGRLPAPEGLDAYCEAIRRVALPPNAEVAEASA